MPFGQAQRKEFEFLMSQLSSGDLDDSGEQRLAELLSNHPEAIEVYLDQYEVEAMLRETYGLLNNLVSPGQRRQSARFPLRSLAIAAIVLFAVSMGFGFGEWCAGYRGVASLQLPVETKLGQVNPPPPLGAVVATIARNSGTKLRINNGAVAPAVVGSPLHAARYELLGGVLELTYESGARVILESPAVVELQTENSLKFVSGRISVRCPTPESKGFMVETPSGVAIDLGTEFAIEVDPNKERDDEYHVFAGEVTIQRRRGRPELLPLKEGQALRLDRDTSAPAGIDIDYQRFIRSFDTVSTDYYDQILKLAPAVYYVMRSGQDGRTLRNEVADESHGTVYSSTPGLSCWAPGFNGGTAFQLDGKDTYAAVQDYPKSQDDRLSVVAWVFAASRPSWASIAKNWGVGLDPIGRGQFHLGLHSLNGDFHGSLEAHINDDDNVEQFAIESIPMPLNRWHHVAMVADGAVLRLYRNGNEVASTTYKGLNGNPAIKALAIGTKLDGSMKPAALNRSENTGPLNQGFWHGRIEHLAIFNLALSPRQIQNLYQVGVVSLKESPSLP